jgi:ribosome biogenesis protein ERB1
MSPLASNRKRKKTTKEQSDASDAEPFLNGGLDSLSEDEGEDGLLQDSRSDDDGDVDAFPEIDAGSDTGDEGKEDTSGDEEEYSVSEDEGEDEDASSDDDLHIFPKAKTIVSDITGQPKKVYPEIDPDYDSDSSTEDVRVILMFFWPGLISSLKAPNRIGNIPLHWYDDLPHVGYDIDGKKVLKPARGDELDKFLKTVDDPSAW